jgi:hypothetical protein
MEIVAGNEFSAFIICFICFLELCKCFLFAGIIRYYV